MVILVILWAKKRLFSFFSRVGDFLRKSDIFQELSTD